MAFAISGFASIAQNWISRGIASNFYGKVPLLAILGALTLGNNNKKPLTIGRPGSAEILSGRMLSPAEKMQLQGINAYCPRIQGFETNNTRAMGVRDTMPTVANATTNSHGQATQNAAKFHWTHLKTPLLIWHEDLTRAGEKGTKEGQGIAASQLIDEATQIGLQDQMKWLASRVWTGNPTSQTQDLWDEPLGLVQALDNDNTYANVDRSVAANAAWRSQVDSTLTTTDVKRIIDDANITKRINVVGDGINCMLTTSTLYQIFKAQVTANNGMRVLPAGLPEFAAMGVKKEVLQVDNVFIMYDEQCPANNVACLDLQQWKLIMHPQQNFRVSSFVDISDKSEGAKDADQAFIHTRLMLTNDNPFLAALYTTIGT